MTVKGFVRSYQAAKRRGERDAQRKGRELQKQMQNIGKMQEAQRAAYEVDVYDNQIDVVTSVHKESSEPWDWKEMAQTPKPVEPILAHSHEDAARVKRDQHKPGMFSKMLGKESKDKERLQQAVEEGKQRDQHVYDEARRQYDESLGNWQATTDLARRVLEGNSDAYIEAIQEANPFSDISALGSQITFNSSAPWYMESTLVVSSNEIIPKQEKSLTKTGKLSTKEMPASRFNEMYQDYVCSCILRVARELFSLLPIEMAIVQAMAETVNPATGRKEEQTILSVAIERQTLETLNLDAIDPSDSMKNFVHKMKFSKAKGFDTVDKVSADQFQR